MLRKDKYNKIVLWAFMLLLCSTFQIKTSICFAAEENDSNDIDIKITKIRQLLKGTPSIVSSGEISILEEIAQTKRLDAAIVLIKSMELSLPNPKNIDEIIQSELLPAIGLLNKYFGEEIAPLLYTEAITTSYPWLRERIALATRTILQKETIIKMNQVFSIDKSTKKSAKEFLDMLNKPILIIDLPTSVSPQEQDLLNRLEKVIKEKKKESEK